MKLPPDRSSADAHSGAVHPLPFGLALACGVAAALVLSTQLLFQPFVWRGFGWDEILQGWLDLAGQRLAVSLPIAAALALASRVPASTALARAALFGLAIVAGAFAGELGLLSAGSPDEAPTPASIASRVTQWCMLAFSVAGLYYLWRRGAGGRAATQAADLRRIRLERELVQARLQALRSQIEPHFLFNTLATVRRLHETDPERGTRLLAHFLDYLRSTQLRREHGQCTLGDEIDLVRAYLAMVEVRMAGRLRVELDVPPALRPLEFPALTIATLVENAVKHGIGPAPEGGCIGVHAARRGEAQLEVLVFDTGVGFSGSGGSGIGLANIRARLQTLYGTQGSLSLATHAPHGVRATMRLPCTWADPA